MSYGCLREDDHEWPAWSGLKRDYEDDRRVYIQYRKCERCGYVQINTLYHCPSDVKEGDAD